MMFGSSWLVLFSFVLFFDQFKLLKKRIKLEKKEKVISTYIKKMKKKVKKKHVLYLS